ALGPRPGEQHLEVGERRPEGEAQPGVDGVRPEAEPGHLPHTEFVGLSLQGWLSSRRLRGQVTTGAPGAGESLDRETQAKWKERDGMVPRSWLLAVAALLPAAASLLADPTAPPELTDKTYTHWRDFLQAKPRELSFEEVPWRTTFWDAVVEAQQKD